MLTLAEERPGFCATCGAMCVQPWPDVTLCYDCAVDAFCASYECGTEAVYTALIHHNYEALLKQWEVRTLEGLWRCGDRWDLPQAPHIIDPA